MSSQKPRMMPERISMMLSPAKNSSSKPHMQPVRIKHLLESFSEAPLATSSKPHMQPVRIKHLLELSSKEPPASMKKLSKDTFAVPKMPVRRALYTKPSPKLPPRPSPARSITSQSSADTKQRPKSSKKSAIPRKSLLPQPNTISRKYIQTVRQTSITEDRVKEVRTVSPHVRQERPTVIRSSIRKSLNFEDSKTQSRIPEVIVANTDVDDRANDELEASIAEKENIPPFRERIVEQAEEKTRQYDFELRQLEMYAQLKSKLDRIEHNQHTVMDMVEKMFNMMTIFMESNKPVSVSHVSSLPHIEASSPKNDKENNTISDKKRRPKTFTGERRRSVRLADKSAANDDSFLLMENNVNAEYPTSNKPLALSAPSSTTPKNNKRQSILKPKSDRALREYVALKASTPFLQTPDQNAFRQKIFVVNDTPSMQQNLRRSISSKVFEELKDLYNDSVEGSSCD